MARAVLLSMAALAAYVCLAIAANRLHQSESGPLTFSPGVGLPLASGSLSVVTWNLGYAGLGADSDFAVDGGKHYFPPSRRAVLANLAGIQAELARMEADVFLIQEVALASPLNYWVDVREGVKERFKGFASVFDPDVATVLIPPPLRVAHGPAIYSRVRVGTAERRMLPTENERYAGLLRRQYRMQIVRLPLDGDETSREWVVVNIHLAAFDDTALVRRRQLREVLAFAKEEFEKGNPVVIGGDWNFEFVKDRFPHTTEDKYRFWLHDFPAGELASGWQAVYDPAIPTVRTLHEPYRSGQNYVTIIDGFVVSPNVGVEWVKGTDMRFQHSDHQPVSARLRHVSMTR